MASDICEKPTNIIAWHVKENSNGNICKLGLLFNFHTICMNRYKREFLALCLVHITSIYHLYFGHRRTHIHQIMCAAVQFGLQCEGILQQSFGMFDTRDEGVFLKHIIRCFAVPFSQVLFSLSHSLTLYLFHAVYLFRSMYLLRISSSLFIEQNLLYEVRFYPTFYAPILVTSIS